MVAPLGAVDATPMADWIAGIPLTAWPQQNPPDGELKPAMICDLNWRGFGAYAQPIVDHVMARYFQNCAAYQQMLSVVMPGHDIPAHRDLQGPKWLTRVHVPLATNRRSKFIVDNVSYQMKVGTAYSVNTLALHAVTNDGKTPRIHFMFDVGRP